MKMPLWESSPGALRALLDRGTYAGRTFAKADLYTFMTAAGPVLQYCTGDLDIGYDPGSGFQTWSGKSVRFDDPNNKALAHWKIGTDVDTWQVVAMPRARDDITGAEFPDTIGTIPFLEAVHGGALDGANVYIDRAFAPAWPQPPQNLKPFVPTGVYPIFAGQIGVVDVARSAAVLNIVSWLALFTLQMPQRLFQYQCVYSLFGPGCNNAGSLPASAFGVNGVVAPGSTQKDIVSAIGTPAGSNTYALGQFVMTSGKNAGFTRIVRSWSGPGGTLVLNIPFYFPVVPGDTFTAYPGCDKTIGDCTAFNNLVNFGGEPFIPQPEIGTV